MLYKTRGIVFQTVNYSDNSFIAKVYTELFGLQSYMVNNPRGKKSSTKINVFQPMNLVELVVYRKEKKQLHRIKEIKIELPYNTIPFDVSKSSITFFLNEILCKCIREEESNLELFQFIHGSMIRLDNAKSKFVCFHLYFLIQLAAHLGFAPSGNFSADTPFFDLHEGIFKNESAENCLGEKASETIFNLLITSSYEIHLPSISAATDRAVRAMVAALDKPECLVREAP